ncbi:hypothetical protein BDP55DRAFT_744065 [Colletotrichum godetiae]|uniref:Uncharacterized protein n=1 Tax=Colletotrichum godetiae TaxID=1209918 RepID=A0AAJ0AQ76_9PEZI|nr:uncharacterized protein BDP55DRAFT_744065 [Colletotrichum godetiae]KAK1675811.1 hypothetical protein BDP55DRAFT_744065 [Colletotrichum godetiae]
MAPATVIESKSANWEHDPLGGFSEDDFLRVRHGLFLKVQAYKNNQLPQYNLLFLMDCINLERFRTHSVAAQAHLKYLVSKAEGVVDAWNDWIDTQDGQTCVIKHSAHQALSGILADTIKDMQSGHSIDQSPPSDFLEGLYLRRNITTTGMAVRDEHMRSQFEDQMINSYCPSSIYGIGRSRYWDPILHNWIQVADCRAAILFPNETCSNKTAVFGSCHFMDILLTVHPNNGLFLHKTIEWALAHGYIAIVPNVDLEPIEESYIHFEDETKRKLKEARTRRLKEWDSSEIKDYKVVVFDNKSSVAVMSQMVNVGGCLLELKHLHNQKLIFLTSHRPQARYMWWSFFSSATAASWRLDLCKDSFDRQWLHRGILLAARYWGTTGPYCENGILTSFADSIQAERTSIHDSLAGAFGAALRPNHAALAILSARVVSSEWNEVKESVACDSDEESGLNAPVSGAKTEG